MGIVPFTRRDRSAVFSCKDCGKEVLSAVANVVYEYDAAEPVCMTCMFIRNNPNITESTKKLLLGAQ